MRATVERSAPCQYASGTYNVDATCGSITPGVRTRDGTLPDRCTHAAGVVPGEHEPGICSGHRSQRSWRAPCRRRRYPRRRVQRGFVAGFVPREAPLPRYSPSVTNELDVASTPPPVESGSRTTTPAGRSVQGNQGSFTRRIRLRRHGSGLCSARIRPWDDLRLPVPVRGHGTDLRSCM